ncbi:MAG: cytidylate kinase-like family protein [Clostridiales bacterium]
MNGNVPISITISKQIGSEGSLLGKKLAKNLNFLYFDSDIIRETAKKLRTHEKNVELFDERIVSIWKNIYKTYNLNKYYTYSHLESYFPSDNEVFKVQSEIIQSISKKQSVIVMGRASFYILRNYQNHVSIFVHSSYPSRVKKVQQYYNISESKAKKLIWINDKKQSNYIKYHTKEDIYDLHNYDLCINTESIGIDNAKEVIISYLKKRFQKKIIPFRYKK